MNVFYVASVKIGAAGTQIELQLLSTGKLVSSLRGIAKNVTLSGTEFVQCLLFRLLHDFCTDAIKV